MKLHKAARICGGRGGRPDNLVFTNSSVFRMKYHHKFVYVGIGKDGNLHLETFRFAGNFAVWRGVGKIVRRRASLLDSKMESYSDLHTYTFAAKGRTYKLSDVVSGGIFYCVGSEVAIDSGVIDKLFKWLMKLVESMKPRHRMSIYGPCLNRVWDNFKDVYDSKIPVLASFKRSKECGPTVLYSFVARGSSILVEFVNWTDGLAQLNDLVKDVRAYRPWNQEKTSDHLKRDHVKRWNADYNTLFDGDYVFFICSTSICMDDCYSTLKEMISEFTCLKGIGVPAVISNLFRLVMRDTLLFLQMEARHNLRTEMIKNMRKMFELGRSVPSQCPSNSENDILLPAMEVDAPTKEG